MRTHVKFALALAAQRTSNVLLDRRIIFAGWALS
jgi:hypothetical protein